MMRFGADEAIVGNFADLYRQVGLGEGGVEGALEQAPQRGERGACVGQPATQRGGHERSGKDDGDR